MLSCVSMPQVNPWLRCIFITYNVFVGIADGFIIVISLALLSPSQDTLMGNDSEVQTSSHIVLFILGLVTMVICILGAYGAYKENPAALAVYLVCVVAGSLLMLRAGVPVATARPNLDSLVEETWRSQLPLDQASDHVKKQAEALQTSLRCCGVFGYADWGDDIPDSCRCSWEKEVEGQCQTVTYRGSALWNYFRQKPSVFTQPCFPFILKSVAVNADVALSVDFTLFTLALLGFVLSSLVIFQMFNTSNKPNTSLTVPVRLTDQPPAYHQLYNQEV